MPRKTLTIVGILLIVIVLSGVPHQWKTIYAVIVGMALVALALKDKDAEYSAKHSQTDIKKEGESLDHGEGEKGS